MIEKRFESLQFPVGQSSIGLQQRLTGDDTIEIVRNDIRFSERQFAVKQILMERMLLFLNARGEIAGIECVGRNAGEEAEGD